MDHTRIILFCFLRYGPWILLRTRQASARSVCSPRALRCGMDCSRTAMTRTASPCSQPSFFKEVVRVSAKNTVKQIRIPMPLAWRKLRQDEAFDESPLTVAVNEQGRAPWEPSSSAPVCGAACRRHLLGSGHAHTRAEPLERTARVLRRALRLCPPREVRRSLKRRRLASRRRDCWTRTMASQGAALQNYNNELVKCE